MKSNERYLGKNQYFQLFKNSSTFHLNRNLIAFEVVSSKAVILSDWKYNIQALKTQ